jgi:signal transduction histidine kinase
MSDASESARTAAPAGLALFVVTGAVLSPRSPAVAGAITVAVAVVAVVISWRRLTGWPLVAGLAPAAAGLVALCHHEPSNVGWFGMCVVAGWAALGAPVLPALATSTALVGTFGAEWLAFQRDAGWAAWIAGTVFTTTVCAFARQQRVLLHRLQEAQAGLAERARAEERNRISGEVHDVIGHALTVSLLHLGGARLALDDDLDEARAALREAERLTRASLEEVRAVVGLVRTPEPSGVAPLPCGTDVPELIESFRRAGTRIDCEVRGDLDDLGSTRGLAVYRIVQEALTNAVRHGDGSAVTVQVDVGGDATMVRVLSGGSPRHAAENGSGLIGMRERAEALGGRLRAGPAAGGWRLEAVLPS